jgi:hypothetical protein
MKTISGKYYVQSLYAIINHRGVVLVFVQSVWNLNIPPRVQFFLWLISNNRVLTRDNLAKRRNVSDPTCFVRKMNLSYICFSIVVWLRWFGSQPQLG